MTDSLNNDSSYDDIFYILTDLNITKIKLIKFKMNDLIDNMNHNKKYNNLPPYLDYILYMLSISFTILNKYSDGIIQILLLVDNYDIHPSIFQSVFANIIFSIYIEEMTINPQMIYNEQYLESITNIYSEIEILMSIFNNIFIDVDEQYKHFEVKLCYNSINSLSNIDFLELLDNINNDIFKQNILDNKILILNTMIVQIEHQTQQSMNDEYFIHTTTEQSFTNNRLNCDLLLFNKIKSEYNTHIINNYNYMTKFEIYNKITDIDILKFEQKNSIYFWINNIGVINGKVLDSMLKNKKQ